MKKLIFLGLLMLPVFIVACGQPPQSNEAPNQQTASVDQSKALLNDISGVWKNSDNTMVTIIVDGGQLQFLIDNEPKLAKIGDIDTENQTVNLLLKNVDTGQDMIWTIRKIDSKNATDGYTLNLIIHDGESYDLGFVRKIGADDKNRVHNIFLQAEQQQREALALEEEAHQLEEEQAQTQAEKEEVASDTIPVEEISAEGQNAVIQGDIETAE